MATVEFFFDISSPWTYMAFHQIQPVCERTGAELVYKPFLVGGVFNKVNPSVYQRRENPIAPKENYYQKDMRDWAAYLGLKLIKPSVFPLNSVKALRGAFVAIEQGRISAYARACFEAYWGEDKDLSQDAELRACVEKAGMDADDLFEKIGQAEYKQKLFQTTDDLIKRGGFGSPTFFLDGDDMYFGNDRIVLLEHAITRKTGG
ncbi:MAG: 2-hydroxychromene-2-carboxylate isomerase [Gammaproteobacteria bacterium]|nr:2-hydroxychromene-2-carboxylate isomerase [Gammaproteobacteria bacterium]